MKRHAAITGDALMSRLGRGRNVQKKKMKFIPFQLKNKKKMIYLDGKKTDRPASYDSIIQF